MRLHISVFLQKTHCYKITNTSGQMIKDRKRALKNKTLSSPAANPAHMRLHKQAFSQESFAGPDLCPSCVERLSVEDT